MYTDDVAEIIIKGRIDRSQIATKGPTSVEDNTVFVVDTSKLTDKDDLKSDDLGAWDNTGSKSVFYRLDEDGKLTKVNKQETTDKEAGIFVIKRRSYSNLSLKSLRRITMTASEIASTCPKDLVFIQYIFEEGEQQVQVKQHGNAKSSRSGPYKRTMTSTKSMIKEQTGSLPAREIVHKVIERRGGIMKVTSSGALPRNRRQVYHIVKESKNEITKEPPGMDDPILQVLVEAKEEQKGRPEDILIREIPLFPEPIIFLATDQQLIDIERFCTNPEKFCVLGVDATFQIASYYFTFTTYRNLLLTTEKGSHPVCIGPGILHKQKLTTSYQTLPLLMTKYRPETAGVLVYGTDGEMNLANAFSNVFQHAQHLCCDIHLKDNIKRKLTEYGIAGVHAIEIMNDIFGKEIGDEIEGGLVHCTSAEQFDACLKSASCKWTTLHENGSKFVEYFLKSKAEVIRECGRSDVRSMCGLGYPPTVYTQNANECMNRIIKADQDPKSSKQHTALLPYIEKIRSEIKRQHEEQFLAVLGIGQYRLADAFSFLRVKEDNFYRMSDPQKRARKKEFLTVSVSEPRRREDQALNTELSVTLKKSGIISVPFPVLEAMFNKAATYVQKGNMAWKVPNDENNPHISTFMVHSKSSSNPHKVILTKKSNRVQCDKACVNWSTYNLCSHCLMVAEISGILKSFIQWFNSRKRSPNLTALVNVNMPKNAGEKTGSKKRKGKANKSPSTGKAVVAQRLPTSSHDAFISTQIPPFQLEEVQTAQLPHYFQPGMQQIRPTTKSSQNLQLHMHQSVTSSLHLPQSAMPQVQPTMQPPQPLQPRTLEVQPTMQPPQPLQPRTLEVQPTMQPPQPLQPRTLEVQPTMQPLQPLQPRTLQVQATMQPPQPLQPRILQAQPATQSPRPLQPCTLQVQATTQSPQPTQPATQSMQPLQLRTLRVQPTIQPQPRMQQVPSSARIVSNATAEAAPLPSRPKPPPGVFAFARLSFLDKRVSQCYGCGKTLKEGGNIPYPPDDLVITTMLHREYYDKEGKHHISPKISSVYFHLNPNCVRASCARFDLASCIVPGDLVLFLFVQHTSALKERFGLSLNS